MKALLSAINIHKSFGKEQAKIDVLKGINLEIFPGEMNAIIGTSGSGKTTLLQILGTLEKPSSGELLYKEKSLPYLDDSKLAEYRNEAVGFIFQHHHLLPEFTAIENIMMPALIAGKNKKEITPLANNLLKEVGLSHRASHKAHELSGGEQQRTALARALIMNPAILLADEPTGNLDNENGIMVFELLKNLCKRKKMAVLMVTHNLELSRQMDHCFKLSNGCLDVTIQKHSTCKR